MSGADLFDLTGRVALVTGSSRGIGEAIGRTLAAYGADVIISSRRQEECENVASSIRDNGHKANAMACHIGDPSQIDRVFNQIKDKYGRLDILVNNAATNPHFGPIINTDVSMFQKTVDVNIRGYFVMCQQGAKIMTNQGGGSIINVASVNGIVPGAMQGIYSITKAAVISMTKAFAKECGSAGVRVNALAPGATDTKFAATLVKNEAILSQFLPRIPLGRVALPMEMAGAVLYLASSASSYTTGSCLVVDGGALVG